MLDIVFIFIGLVVFGVFAAYVHGLRGHLMLANVIWGVGALIIGDYMIVALLRPEKF